MKKSYHKVPIFKAPGGIQSFPLGLSFFRLSGFEWVSLNHFPFLEGRAGQNKHLFYEQNKKEKRNMSKSKIMGVMALIAFAMGILLVGNAVAGEKFKGRTVMYGTKWEQINVGDEDGHVVAVYESKGISTNLEGKQFFDGWPIRETGVMDINLKTGVGSGHGYG